MREPPAAMTAENARGGHRLSLIVLSLVIAVTLVGGTTLLVTALGDRSGGPGSAQPPASGAPSTTKNGDGSASGAEPSTTSRSSTTDSPKKVVRLGDHPLLSEDAGGLPNLVCRLPKWDNSRGKAKTFFRAATRCLDRAWGRLLRANDLPFTPPRLYFPSGSRFSSDCGTIEVGIDTAAYYCEGELFLPWGGLQIEQYDDNPGVYLALIAHEYGHHVQELAGIMDAAWREIYEAGENSEKGKEMSRRKELQAQCFSGMFLGSHVDRGGSIDRDMYDKAWQDQETRGDDTSGGTGHGSNESYARWWRVGALDNRISDCNTFTASTSEVS